MKKKIYVVYGGNLRTINFTVDELRSLQLVSTYARERNRTISNVYYAIHKGYLPAKKIRGKYRVLPIDITNTKLLR